MIKKYEFYPIDGMDKVGIIERHDAYLRERLKLKKQRQYLSKFEVDILEEQCKAYEYAMSVLLPESKTWTWAEWEDDESVAEKLQKKYDNFFDGKTSTAGFMYGKKRAYYEVVVNVLKDYFVDGDDTVMMFTAFSQEKELVAFIARLLHPIGTEDYLKKIFVEISERIIAYVRKEDEDFFSELLSAMDFRNSYLYQHMLFLQDKGDLDCEVKRLLYTVAIVS